MSRFLLICLVLGFAVAASAYELGSKLPAKAIPVFPENVPSAVRQGGDNAGTATVIPALPFTDTGTTEGYVDDYDEICPYSGSTSPDVVYSFNAVGDWGITVDLCGSAYDTKTYIYDASFNLIACNDDFYFDSTCGPYVSKIEDAVVSGQVYIVIDGYYGAFGAYTLAVTGEPWVPCVVYCPPYSDHEGEPPLVDGYVDHYNGGCNTIGYPFMYLPGNYMGDEVLCGVSGWYLFNGAEYRDTDWYEFRFGGQGLIEIVADAEQPTYIFELGPHDCAEVGVIQLATAGPCAATSMTIQGAPLDIVWFWVGPTTFAPPQGEGNEYDYVVWMTGLEGITTTESTTWSTVKALYE